MQFHNRQIIVLFIFGILLIVVSVSAYTMGRLHAERNFYEAQVERSAPMRLAGGIVGTLGRENIFYTTYCGSSCLGFEVINLTTKKTHRGSLSFLSDDRGNAYTIFDDWIGNPHRFDGEFVSVGGRERGEKLILDFAIKDEETGESIIHSVEF